MRYREIISEASFHEVESQLLGDDDDIWMEINDRAIPWMNENKPRCIGALIRSPKVRLASQLHLWAYLKTGREYSSPTDVSVEEFQQALNEPITVYRGGGGTFNPDFRNSNSWVSFTASKARMKTFSEYDGTYASKKVFLDKRMGKWWEAELTIPLKRVMLYLPWGGDFEVIVSKADAKLATVTATGGKSWEEHMADLRAQNRAA